MRQLITYFLFGYCLGINAQVLTERTPPDFIKTIIFKDPKNDKNQFPIVRLNQMLTLQFDDLSGDEETYYYKITHCNADWTASNLLKSEYIKGMDEQPLRPESNSYATLQSYSHYRLNLPNDVTKITLTGNYILSIIDRFGEELFSRRFIVYNPLVNIQSEIKRTRDLQHFDTKQVVQFSIKEINLPLQDPTSNVKVIVLQNYRWNNAITNLKAQFTMGRELIYKHDLESAFDGGNEYFYFDSKELRVTSGATYQIFQNNLFEHVLFGNTSRANRVYTYNPDINGDFLINTLDGRSPDNEADYVWIHFSLDLPATFGNKDVYVYGKFSNYELLDTYKLTYNEGKGIYQGKILLKQGFYNYKFATKERNNENFNEIGGNFQQTENNYTILVYYRGPNALYDQVIGVGGANSSNISR